MKIHMMSHVEVRSLTTYNILSILGWFYLDVTILPWYTDPNGTESKDILKYPFPSGIKKCEILIIDTQMVY